MNDLNKLTQWYEHLSEATLKDIDNFYSENVFFKDPFNEFTGREKVKSIFEHMFTSLNEAHFVFIETIQQGSSAFITWNFIFKFKDAQYKIHGSSHLKFDELGKISYHRDYWDVGEELLLKLPLIKSIYKIFQQKFALKEKGL